MPFSLNIPRSPGFSALLVAGATALGGCSTTAAAPPASSPDAVVMVASPAAGACPMIPDARPYTFGLDPTELATIEAQAKTDVVFVAADGCSLRVLPACYDVASRGARGGYRPLMRTAANQSRMVVANLGELYTKLPIGAPALAPRIAEGESLQFDYFVRGMREAEYGEQYRADLASIPGCAGATHFVHAYAAGAFARVTPEGEYTAPRGGHREACGTPRADDAACVSPVRLYLRPIVDGHRPPQALLDVATTRIR